MTTLTSKAPLGQEDEEKNVIITCEDGEVRTVAHGHTPNPSPLPESWDSLKLESATRPAQLRWLCFESEPAGQETLLRYLKGTYEVYAIGTLHRVSMPPVLVGIVKKDRSSWAPPQGAGVLKLLHLGMKPLTSAANRVANATRLFGAISAIFSACTGCHSNLRVRRSSTVEEEDPEALFLQVEAEWLHLSELEIERQIGVARARPKARRTPRQQTIVASHSSLMGCVKHAKKLASNMRWRINDPRIPALAVFSQERLWSLRLQSFCPDTGRLVSLGLREYLEQGYYAQYALVLLGGAHKAKTPLAKCLASLITRTWCCDMEGHSPNMASFYITSQVDALRYVMSDAPVGSVVILDDFTPTVSAGGRTKHCTPEEVKELTSTVGGVIPTRFGDTPVPGGGRIITSNATTLRDWGNLRSDGFPAKAPAERVAMANGDWLTGAVHKRCLFAWVTHAMIPEETAERRWDDIRQQHASRMRRALATPSDVPEEVEAAAPVAVPSPGTPKLL